MTTRNGSHSSTKRCKPIGVAHIIDALNVGGAERMVVNIVNALPRERFAPHVITTRYDGPLSDAVADDVGRLALNRRSIFDYPAILRLRDYVAAHHIQLIHAHSTSLFIASAVARMRPFPALMWHDHYGGETAARSALLYRAALRNVNAVISVNDHLRQWCITACRVPETKVSSVVNFATPTSAPMDRAPTLPGSADTRLVCVANFRAQKDHPTLLRAFSIVVQARPDAQLILVGQTVEPAATTIATDLVTQLGIADNTTIVSTCHDVRPILAECAIGVLSSTSEGLPVALLEYGHASLATVVTNVGRNAEIVDAPRAGVLVNPGDQHALATALLELLSSPERRRQLGASLNERIDAYYSERHALNTITTMYETVLGC